jgi:hypothetical protein
MQEHYTPPLPNVQCKDMIQPDFAEQDELLLSDSDNGTGITPASILEHTSKLK